MANLQEEIDWKLELANRRLEEEKRIAAIADKAQQDLYDLHMENIKKQAAKQKAEIDNLFEGVDQAFQDFFKMKDGLISALGEFFKDVADAMLSGISRDASTAIVDLLKTGANALFFGSGEVQGPKLENGSMSRASIRPMINVTNNSNGMVEASNVTYNEQTNTLDLIIEAKQRNPNFNSNMGA